MIPSSVDAIKNKKLRAQIADLSSRIQPFRAVHQFWKRPDTIIYQYTSLDAAVQIIKSGELHFTERLHMNDSAEMTHAYNVGMKMISEAASKLKCNELLMINEFLTLNRIDEADATRFFMSCFSVDGNSLPQWRSYADDGRGVALGFDPVIRARVAPGHSNTMGLLMDYDDTEMLFGFDEMIAEIADMQLLRTVEMQERDHALALLANILAGYLFSKSMDHKHSAYRFEQEYRLLLSLTKKEALNDETRDVKVRPGEVVHFVSRKLDPPMVRSLRTITVGPAASGSVKEQLEYLLESKGYKQCVVDKSDIPYRSVR